MKACFLHVGYLFTVLLLILRSLSRWWVGSFLFNYIGRTIWTKIINVALLIKRGLCLAPLGSGSLEVCRQVLEQRCTKLLVNNNHINNNKDTVLGSACRSRGLTIDIYKQIYRPISMALTYIIIKIHTYLFLTIQVRSKCTSTQKCSQTRTRRKIAKRRVDFEQILI